MASTNEVKLNDLEIETRRLPDGGVHVQMHGEADVGVRGQLQRAIARAETETAPDGLVVLDMREVAFVDSTALNQIVRADARLRARAGRLVVLVRRGLLLSLFVRTGLDRHLELVREDDPKALASIGLG